MSAYEDFIKTKSVPETPLGTCTFLNKFNAIIGCKFSATSKNELLTQTSKFKRILFMLKKIEINQYTFILKAIMNMFDWLLCYMLDKSYKKLEKNLKQGKDLFTARNENQVFYSKTLAIIFIEVGIIFLH